MSMIIIYNTLVLDNIIIVFTRKKKDQFKFKLCSIINVMMSVQIGYMMDNYTYNI
eukprot:UN03467